MVLGIVLVLGIATPYFFRPQEAQAFPGEAWAVAQWTFIKKKIETAIYTAKHGALELAYKNALRTFFTQMARDTAIRLTTSGPGQGPLFITDKHYYTNLASGAAGDFLDTLGTKAFGIDVCQPQDLNVQISIQQAVEKLATKALTSVSPNVPCEKEYNKALKEGKLIVGQGKFDPQYTSDSSRYGVTLQQAKAKLAKLYTMRNDPFFSAKCAADAINNPSTCPASLANRQGDILCGYKDANQHSLGECIQVYEHDTTEFQKTADANLKKCFARITPRVQRCSATDVFRNFEQLGKPLKLAEVTKYFDPGENDIGTLFTLTDKLQQKAVQAEVEERDATAADYIPLRDKVTGEILTPKTNIKKEGEKLSEDKEAEVAKIHSDTSLWADVRDIFLTTLLQRKSGLTQRLMDLLYKKGVKGGSAQNTKIVNGKIQTSSGLQAARAIITSLLQPRYNTGGASTSLDDLAACPDANPGPNNCVIGQGFSQAVQQGLTLREALEQNLIDGNQPFGYRSVGATQSDAVEPDFREGIPYRSILILRRLRIVPVGWELAAQYIRDYGGCVSASQPGQRTLCTLQQLIDVYDACDAEHNAWSPFCGLVDPEWVLKAPETFCAVSGFTAELTTNDYFPDPVYPDAPQVRQTGRAEACVDEKTCLQEDDQGRCLAFGYCVQERPTWRFGGTQCTNYFHSCDTFSLGDGQESTYTTNSLDYGTCSAANAGCAWYCRDVSSGGAFTCTDTDGNKDYLTAAAKGCPSDEAGCAQYARTTNGSNLVTNGSFEMRAESAVLDDGAADDYSSLGWATIGGPKVESVSDANTGSVSVKITEGLSDRIQASFAQGSPLNGRSYTLSYYAKTTAASCDGLTAGVEADTTTGADGASQTFDAADSWQRYVQTVTFDAAKSFITNTLRVYFSGTATSCSFELDDVQLEAGGSYSAYKEYGSENKLYLNGKRASCPVEDVGCDLYTSATDQIPGIATNADSCPADQVGCKAFLEVPVTENGADSPNASVSGKASRTGKRCSEDQSLSCFSESDCVGKGSCDATVSLIPSTGKQCAASSVGCEEYTNLDTVAKGGEGIEYYTYIRPCIKPGDDPDHEKTFYTWIGSDRTGFQLQAYVLQSTDLAYTQATDTTGGGPAYINGENDIALTPTVQCSASIFANPDDPNWTPDCRQFYDSGLNVYYRLYARTVTISDDCHPLRNTLDNAVYNAIPSEGTTCPANENLCREYRGPSGFNTRNLINDNFDDADYAGWSGGTTSSQSLTFGGSSLSVASAAQTDATLDIPHQVQQGRSYVITFWAASAKDCDGTQSKPCPSIAASFAGGSETFAGIAQAKWTGGETGIPQWNAYTLGPLNLLRAPDTDAGDSDPADDLLIAGTKPFYIDNIRLQEIADSVYLVKNTAALCAGYEGCDQYTNRNNEVSYLKGFTRLCPVEKVGCEALINTQNSDSPFSEKFDNGTNIDGSPGKDVPADTVEYVVNDPTVYCREENQGCTQLGKPTLGQAGSSCVNDPTKRCLNETAFDVCGTVGLCQITFGSSSGICLNNRSTACTTDADCGSCVIPEGKTSGTCNNDQTKSCTKDENCISNLCAQQDITVQKYDGVYRIEDPESYTTALCKVAEVGCNAWKDNRTGDTQYFRDPEPYTCEYKTVTVNGRQISGWYKAGTSGLDAGDPCPGTTTPAPVAGHGVVPVVPYSQPTQAVCQGDETVTCSVDKDCTTKNVAGPCIHYAGICPADQAGCAEYRDQGDPESCRSQCLLTVDQTYGDAVPVGSDCNIELGTCSGDASKRCFRDQECSDANAGSCTKTTGCRGYYYLSQSVEDDAEECNGIANDEQGCRKFYTEDKTSLNGNSAP